MLATLIIVFREVLEAALITGVVLAATRGLSKRIYWVVYGILGGIVGAGIVAVFAGAIADAVSGVGQEIFNASVLFLAVLMLGWHNIWMSRHARELSLQMHKIGGAVSAGRRPLYALSVVIGLAVLREGSETVLFLYGITASGNTSFPAMLIGATAGLGAGVAVGLLLYFGLLRIPARHLFNVTSWMVLLLAAGLSSQGAAFLVQADILPALGYAIWDTSLFLSEHSVLGRILHTLIGYVSQPMGIQILFYVTTIITEGVLMRLCREKNARPRRSAGFVAMLIAIGVIAYALPQPAKAGKKVYSPIVEKGEFEIEFRGHRDFDREDTKDNKQKQIYEIGYGVTDRWHTSVFVEAEKEPGEGFAHEATSWENVFQLAEQGEYWLDAGLYAEYEIAADADDPNKVEVKLLLEKSVGHSVNTLNLIFEKETGSNSGNDLVFGYAWRTKWKVQAEFEPGFELYGEFGPIDTFVPSEEQSHQLGPVASGMFHLGSSQWKLKYDVGYLFGLTHLTPNSTLKFGLEFERSF